MHSNKNKPEKATVIGRDQRPDESGSEYGGFLVLKFVHGDCLQIGDSIIYIKRISQGAVSLAVKAKKDVKITKLT